MLVEFDGEEGFMGLRNLGGWPCWVAVKRYRAYAALRSVIKARRGQSLGDHEMILENRKISLRRLRAGGAAMLAAVARNHQSIIWGAIAPSPFVI